MFNLLILAFLFRHPEAGGIIGTVRPWQQVSSCSSLTHRLTSQERSSRFDATCCDLEGKDDCDTEMRPLYRLGTLGDVPCSESFKFQVSSSKFQVPSFKFRFHVPSFGSKVASIDSSRPSLFSCPHLPAHFRRVRFHQPPLACYNRLSAVDSNASIGFLVRQLPSANT